MRYIDYDYKHEIRLTLLYTLKLLQLSAMVGCLTPAEPDYVVKRLGTRKSLIRAAC